MAPPARLVRGGRSLVPIALGVLLFIPVGVFIWSVLLSPMVADARVIDRLIYANQRSMGVEVVDQTSRYLGMIHYKADPKLDYVEPQDFENLDEAIQRDVSAYDIRPDHKTIHLLPEEVPPHFWTCLVYLEDREMGKLRNPAGIDFWTAFKIPIDRYGGSTVPMMISRHMRKSLPSSSESVQTKLWRKLNEWWEAPTIWRFLGEGTPGRGGLKAWSAQHVVLLTQLGGAANDIVPDVYGVQTAARLLFGKQANELSVAEQLILAAAYKRPLVPYRPSLDPESPAARQAALVLQRWKAAADRARRCSGEDVKLFPEDIRAQADDDLVALGKNPPSMVADGDLLRASMELSARRDAADAARRIEHPYAKLRALVPRPHRRFIVDLVTDRFGRNWRNQVRRVELTLDMPADLRFQRKMNAAWVAFERANSVGWLLNGQTAGSMGYLVVAADDRGRIVRFYEGGTARQDSGGLAIPRQEGGSARYPGPMTGDVDVDDVERRCPRGRAGTKRSPCPFAQRVQPYPRGGREVASLGKIIAAIALAERGAAPASSTISSFAVSQNESVENLLRQVDPIRLQRLLDAFGFSRSDSQTPLRTAVSQGFVRATPREVHRLIASALAIARGKFDEPIAMPTLVSRYDLFDPDLRAAAQRLSPDGLDQPIDLAALLLHEEGPSREQISRFVAATLSAPVCSSGGTLSALKHWCSSGARKTQLHIAKTGTRANANNRQTVDAWVAGGIVLNDGRAYTYVVLAGTGQPSRPFHTSTLNANRLSPVIDILLDDLSASPPTAVAPKSSPNK